MSFLNNIGKLISGSSKKAATVAATSSRSVARERLSVILAAQRGSNLLEGVDMEALQKDVMEVVQVSFIFLKLQIYLMELMRVFSTLA